MFKPIFVSLLIALSFYINHHNDQSISLSQKYSYSILPSESQRRLQAAPTTNTNTSATVYTAPPT